MDKKLFTIEELKEISKVTVYIDSEEEWKKFKEYFNTTGKYYGQHYYSNMGDYSENSNKNNIGSYNKNYTTLEFNQILFPERIIEDFQIY